MIKTNHDYECGDFDAARLWIESSSLSDDNKKAFLQFVHRFPGLIFYKENAVLLDKLEEDENVNLPKWFRDIRQTLAFFMPNHQVEVKFGNFDNEDIEEVFDDSWYTLGLGYIDAQREIMQSIEDLLPFPIGGSIDNIGSELVINTADPTDQAVYEHNTEYLWDDLSDGIPLSSGFGKVFDSYAEMFKHIVAIKIQNGEEEIIEAQE
ncbi:MAG TPA: hypothetical protein VK184_09515 [Nostocaceae cyanobacterium]|nr:hypothetical protein [Nostocaceae cyanobacterium]